MKTHYGGQALIEGVLMRGKSGVFVAVRAPDGRIVTREERLAVRKGPFARLPVVRGVLALGDTISVGTKMLLFSADIAAGGSGESPGPVGRRATMGGAIAAASILSVLPNLLARLLGRRKPGTPPPSNWWSNLVESGTRVGILVGYLLVIGRIKEVQRVFAYHGAEHKSISALEADAPLTPEAVQRFQTAHPRCGTAFLLQSMLTSSVVYGAVGGRTPLGKIGTRLALVPVVAGISYEVLQWNARHLESPLVRALNLPGMLLQRLTTREPSDDQVEVALSALRGAMAMEDRSA
jgi:uncharacterized protein YqhQ